MLGKHLQPIPESFKRMLASGLVGSDSCQPEEVKVSPPVTCHRLNNLQDSISDFFDDVINGNSQESIEVLK